MLNKKENTEFKDIQTDKRIHEHLSNKEDIISEEDINNIKTDVAKEATNNLDDTSGNANKPEDEMMERHGKKTGRSDDPGIGTSWNILND